MHGEFGAMSSAFQDTDTTAQPAFCCNIFWEGSNPLCAQRCIAWHCRTTVLAEPGNHCIRLDGAGEHHVPGIG